MGKFETLFKNSPKFLELSPKSCAIMESLLKIPMKDRKVKPTLAPISITSDGYIIAGGKFYVSIEPFERELEHLCYMYDIDTEEIRVLFKNCLDYRNI